MPVPQSQQITLEMVLRAQDQASAAIKQVGAELATLGKDTKIGDLSAGVRESLAAVQQQLRQASAERTELARTASAQDLAAARTEREGMLRAAKLFFDQELRAAKGASDEEKHTLEANREAALGIIRHMYEERVSTARRGLMQETNAISSSLQEQLRQQRAYGDTVIAESRRIASEQAKAAQAGERAAASGGGAREGGYGPVERFAHFGEQLLVWNLGYAAVGKVTQAFGDMAAGLITVNKNLEQYQATFNSIYQSKEKGQAAVAWLTDFAVKVPATREQVIQAGLAVASLGDNVTEVLPALSNVAAVMGVDLPRAAQAFADAQEGRFQMMQTTLHITKQELVQYGLQLDASGHVLNNSFVPAFEKLGNVRFGAAAAEQMHTFGGLISNVADAFTKLQEIMGKPIFDLLKGKLQGLIDLMGRNDVQRWALGIGQAIAHMLAEAMHAGQWMIANFGPPVVAVINIIALAWQKAAPLIAGAVRLIEGVLGGIGSVLQRDVLPVVQNAIGQIVLWWQSHGKDVGTALDSMGKVVKQFYDWLSTTAHGTLLAVQGTWTTVWGVLAGVVAVVIDIISGHWKKAKTDLLNIWYAIEVGVLQIVNGLVDNVIQIFGLLAGPVRSALNAIFPPAFKAVVDVGIELFTFLQLKIEQSFLRMIDTIGGALSKMATKWGPILQHLPGGHILAAGLYGAAALAPRPTLSDQDIGQMAQAAGRSGAAAVGGLLGPAPIPPIPFDAKKATVTVDAFFAGLEKKIDANLTTGSSDIGKKWLDAFNAELKKHHITPPLLPATGGAAGTLDLSQPGYSTTTAGEQKKATDQVVRDAQDRFQLLLDSGKATWSTGIADINAILKAEKAAGASPVQMQLDALRDTKELVGNLLDTARKQFDFDSNVAHPSRAKLQQDEAAVLDLLKKTPGIKPVDLASAKQQMDKNIADALKHTGQSAQDALAGAQQKLKYEETLQMPYKVLKAQVDVIMADLVRTGVAPGSLQYRATYKQLMDEIGKQTGTTGAGGVQVPTPLYGPYRIATAQYGATQVSFGGTQQNNMAALVQHLQALVSYWQARARRDEDALRAQQQIAASSKETAVNTANLPERLARVTGSLGLEPAPAGGAGAGLRKRGGFAVIRR